jgi:hypothetical protein
MPGRLTGRGFLTEAAADKTQDKVLSNRKSRIALRSSIARVRHPRGANTRLSCASSCATGAISGIKPKDLKRLSGMSSTAIERAQTVTLFVDDARPVPPRRLQVVDVVSEQCIFRRRRGSATAARSWSLFALIPPPRHHLKTCHREYLAHN